MNNNPFLTALKVLFTGFLAFFVFMVFWQGTHLETQMTEVRTVNSQLSDRVAEMSRKVDEVKAKADRLEGAADAMAKMLANGVRVESDSGSRGGPSSTPAVPSKGWGWELNASLDVAPDASKSVGTPGRYANFLSKDPDPEVPPEASQHADGTLGMVYSKDPKGFNFIIEKNAELQEDVRLYVASSPAGNHWKNPYKYSPDLCWRVEVSPDFREYTLFFRHDVVWHSPMGDLSKSPHLRGVHRVTAHDYKFVIDMIENPAVESAHLRAYFDDVESVTVPDDFTAIVRWKKTLFHSINFTLSRDPMPEFLYAYDERGNRFPDETMGQEFNKHWYNQVGVCGCGPYRMARYQSGQWITLERFDDWFGAREGVRYGVKTLKFLIYNDPETLLLKLEAGELGITGMGSTQWKAKVINNKDPKSPFNDGRIKTYKGLRPGYMYIGWKLSNPLFRDRNVRLALALACNRDEINEKVLLGHYRAMSSPVFPGSQQADPDLKPLAYEPERAKALLDAAGWKMNAETGIREKVVDGQTKRFEFALSWVAPNPDSEAMINQYRNDLRTIGVVLNPVALDWSIMQQKLEDREFEACLGQWGTEAWDHDFEQLWHSRQARAEKSSNHVGFMNDEVDRLSDDLRAEMDIEKRIEKVRRIGRVIFEEQPYLFFGWVVAFGAHWDWVKNAEEHWYKDRPFVRAFPIYVVPHD